MVQFCRVQDVADLLRIAINPEDTGVLMAITQVSAAMQNYCQQTLYLVADDVVTLDVEPHQNRIFLPELPVVSVASVVEDGETLVVGRDEDYLLGSNGILYRQSGRGWWVAGVQMVTVTYTHGHPLDYDFDGWPDDLRGVCARASARQFQAGLRAAETAAVPGVAGTTIGDYAVQYSAESAGGNGGALLGVSAGPVLLKSEKEILDRYKLKRLV